MIATHPGWIVLAHAFGKRYDLPIPLPLFLIGGAAVVLLSFALVASRATGSEVPEVSDVGPSLRRGPAADLPAGLALLVGAALLVCGWFGSQTVSENILPTVFWLLVWIGVPLSCGLIGDWTRRVNPFLALARWADHPGLRRALIGRSQELTWPARLGWWPAVVGYALLAEGELVVNLWATRPAVIATGLLVYAVLNVLGGLLFGAAWRDRGEVFAVLFTTWGRLGYWRHRAVGRRGFGGGLRTGFDPSPSRTAFVLLLLVSVTFDGLLATPRWSRLEATLPGALPQHSVHLELFRTTSMLVLGGVVAAVFGSFAVAAARAGGRRESVGTALTGLLPSLLPIAFGYLLAHNAQYLLVNGQLLAPLLGNPAGVAGWPITLPYPFRDSYEVHPTFLPSAFYWYLGVVAIVGAHVVAVLLAHRHLAARGRDPHRARTSEYPWLVAMVGYTVISLVLIAQPLTRESTPASAPAATPASASR